MNRVFKLIFLLILVLYFSFLLAPFCLNDLSYTFADYVVALFAKQSGLRLKIENPKIITSPKLAIGLGAEQAEIALPSGERFVTVDNLKLNLFIIPLLSKDLKIDSISAENLNFNLKINRNGQLLIINNLKDKPFISNIFANVPNISINNYNISVIEVPTDKSYSIYGDYLLISNCIYPNSLKVSVNGSLSSTTVNAFVNANTRISRLKNSTILNGIINISDLVVLADNKSLTPSNIDLKFGHDKVSIYSKVYTAANEYTEIIGDFLYGKKPKLKLNCKSNASLDSVVSWIKIVSNSVNIHDFDLLKGNGMLDADFYIKTDSTNIESSGYLKLSSGSVSFMPYNISFDDINADIDFSNNSIDIIKAELISSGTFYNFKEKLLYSFKY